MSPEALLQFVQRSFFTMSLVSFLPEVKSFLRAPSSCCSLLAGWLLSVLSFVRMPSTPANLRTVLEKHGKEMLSGCPVPLAGQREEDRRERCVPGELCYRKGSTTFGHCGRKSYRNWKVVGNTSKPPASSAFCFVQV